MEEFIRIASGFVLLAAIMTYDIIKNKPDNKDTPENSVSGNHNS